MFASQIRLSNFLSFGPDEVTVPLGNLNVLIGPNGSGKSNFIEAVSALRGCARSNGKDIENVILEGGGVTEWIWKGGSGSEASLCLWAETPLSQSFIHLIRFRAEQQRFVLTMEMLQDALPRNDDDLGVDYFYSYRFGHRSIKLHEEKHDLNDEQFAPDQSILAQLRDPVQYPELTYLASEYEQIRIYREWTFGRSTSLRKPQASGGRLDRLEEDLSNLAMFLNRLMGVPSAKRTILSALRDIYDGVTDIGISVVGSTVQIFLEEGDYTIPSIRLSDGTLRYLCLLAILCDPTPPPLICIEEPELGLHPDLIPKLADLLVVASERTQLIVTTHSEILVDALTARPEAILICEKQDGKTQMNRLNREDLSAWLDRYRLEALWTKGVLGGNRW